MDLRQAVIIAFAGQTRDRFAVYHTPRTTEEKLELVRKVDGVRGVEVVFPYETGTPGQTAGWLKQHGLEWAAVNVNVKAEPEFLTGSVSRCDSAVRSRAVKMIREAKDFAAAVGAPLVTCCPLSDGYDYLFQVDYARAWRNLVDTFGEAASYRPEIPLCVEYKYSEMRVHCLVDTAAKALLLCRDAGVATLGVTIDFGHAIYGGENPAQSLCLVAESGHPWYLHTNDNDGKFDWDMIGASRHFPNYVEFLFYAREYNYDRFLTTDASPRSLDIVETFTRHIALTAGIWRLVDNLDRAAFRRLMQEENTGELLNLVQRDILRV